MICDSLDCRVNSVANVVIGPFLEDFYDEESEEALDIIPISSVLSGEDYDELDEQCWIGVDAALGDGPIYQLFTSNAYEEVYPNLDAFLIDLREED